MKHDYMLEAITKDDRKITMFGSFPNCVLAAEHAKASNPHIKSLKTRLIVNGSPIDYYLI